MAGAFRGRLGFALCDTHFRTSYVVNSTGGFRCPVLTGVRRDMVVDLSPAYYNYSLCVSVESTPQSS